MVKVVIQYFPGTGPAISWWKWRFMVDGAGSGQLQQALVDLEVQEHLQVNQIVDR